MLGLTISNLIFDSDPNPFIREHISQVLIEQFNKSHVTESSYGLTGFNFYFDHAVVMFSTKKGEIYSFQKFNYEAMLPNSFLQSLSSLSYCLPSHWKTWLNDSHLELLRKEIAQSLNFNRLKLSYNLNENKFYWNWKSHNITLLMNSSFVFKNIKSGQILD